MQTFIIDPNDMNITAKILDNKRLGKQRIEVIQILNTILYGSRWKNHPAVKMWVGYKSFLLYEYLFAILNEWENRRFKNIKCKEYFDELKNKISKNNIKKPEWLNEEFCLSHKSNLIRKKPEYYRIYWPDVPDNLLYIWPVK